jgi:hypothetical protein
LSGGDTGNYNAFAIDLTQASASNAATIGRADYVSISGSKTYDGNAGFQSGQVTITGVGGETFHATATSNSAKASSNGGASYFTGVGSLSGGDTGNYNTFAIDLTQTSASNVATIGRATVTLGVATKTYDGGTGKGDTTLTISGVGSETLSFSALTYNAKDVNANGSNYLTSVMLADGTDGSGGLAGNYQIPTLSHTTAPAMINKATLGVTGSRVYNGGTVFSAADLTLVGVIDNDTVILSGRADVSGKNVGTYTGFSISSLGLDNGNYTLGGGSVNAHITPATLMISASGVSKVYDGTTIASVNLSDNRVAGDDLGISGTMAVFSDKNVGSGKAVSVRGLTLSGTDAGNYVWNTTASTYAEITAKVINLDGSKPYNGTIYFAASNFGNSGVIAGVGSETLTLTGTGSVASPDIVAGRQTLNPGDLKLTDGAGGGLSRNYTLTGGNHFGTIINNPLFVPSNIPPKEFDDDPESIQKRRKLQSTNPDDPIITAVHYTLPHGDPF